MVYESNVGAISRSLLPEETIKWCVPNLINRTDEFRERTGELTVITSPWFSYDGGEWCLALTVSTPGSNITTVIERKSCIYTAECMGLFLWRNNPGKMNYNITLKMIITVQTADQSFILQNSNGEISGQLDSFGSFGTYGFLAMSTLPILKSAISPNGLMNFICKIKKAEITEQILSVQKAREIGVEDKKLEESEESCNENGSGEVSELKGVDRLIENLKSLCLDDHHSDFVLRVDGREFRVYRGILGARSPVFAAMFKHDMVEKKEDGVDIPDCVAPAFQIFLLYLYTGRAENLSQDNIFDVYYAADKYKVDDLKAECVEFMKSNLSVSTFCNVIALSMRHGEKKLLKVATCFFKENIKEIIKTVHWQKYLTENPISANELLIKALDN